MMRSLLLVGFFCALCISAGCADSKPQPVTVSGTVELDGKPMADGSISLLAAAGDVPQSFDVKNGKFEGKSTPGKKRVEIRAYRPGKETKMGDTIIPGAPENYLPPQYNADSKITAEVTASGINPSKFEAQSK